jgi:dihydroneopterin aldolase
MSTYGDIDGVHAYVRYMTFDADNSPTTVDVELWLDLAPAGRSDDLAATIDYGLVYDEVALVLDGPPRNLLESLAESVARGLLTRFDTVDEVVVRVRKPAVRLGGPLDHASVEIQRRRP